VTESVARSRERWWPRLLFVFLVGCAPPAIELSLVLPAEMPVGFSLGCVKQIVVGAIGKPSDTLGSGREIVYDCLEVPELTTFSDVRRAMSGQFELRIPELGLDAVFMSGSAGRCEIDRDAGLLQGFIFHESIFHASAPSRSNDPIVLAVTPNASCAGTRSSTARAFDLFALATGGGCRPVSTGRVFAGTIHPQFGGLSPSLFEEGPGRAVPTGTASVTTYAGTVDPRACIAIGYDSSNARRLSCGTEGACGGGCLDPKPLTACAGAGEIDVPVLDNVLFQGAVATVSGRSQVLVGAAFTQQGTTTTSLRGATVTLDDPNAGEIVYLVRTSQGFTRSSEAFTGTEGWFAVGLSQGHATAITVTAPLHRPQRFTIATAANRATVLAAVLSPL
jgi:hypothetical protein